jgi:two-component system chemotaxis response regulator CheB
MVEIIAIAASTGGPRALCELLKNLPRSFRAGILLTQHLPDGFTAGFARWLDHELALDVEEAVSGQMVHPGKVLLAPSRYHLTVKPPGVIFLSDAPPDENLRPSANPMFQSVAEVYGSRSIGIILTGMGEDGARGLLALHRAGGLCIAQDEASSIIFGMPNVAIKLGAVDHVLNISEISNMLLSHVSKSI